MAKAIKREFADILPRRRIPQPHAIVLASGDTRESQQRFSRREPQRNSCSKSLSRQFRNFLSQPYVPNRKHIPAAFLDGNPPSVERGRQRADTICFLAKGQQSIAL